ncbi:hypothetical protein [Motilimonas pumila]|uniref:Uncharacterized protein n=1 Tax=Motilimonas pumila TaxID=2303987 RepID=A0A418YK56_9GAMM|nr:hypothetical protein [Motilimonas pumila]RJG51353.1 hypothetical protein D1Z90_01055 [Motilimonas pumila]
MTDKQFLSYLKKVKLPLLLVHTLLLIGVTGCVNSLYFSIQEKAASWPLYCVAIALICWVLLQYKVEKSHD